MLKCILILLKRFADCMCLSSALLALPAAQTTYVKTSYLCTSACELIRQDQLRHDKYAGMKVHETFSGCVRAESKI